MTFPDGGRSYLSKFYDDNWMLQYGFMERRAPAPTVARGDPLPERRRRRGARPRRRRRAQEGRRGDRPDAALRDLAAARRPARAASTTLTDIVGSIQERSLLDRVFRNPDALNDDVAVAMQPPLATVDAAASVDEVFAELTGSGGAVVVGRGGQARRDPHAV